mgnify:CR=1 FL=1
MLQTVEGVYREGEIELSERPSLPGPTRVLVTFLDEGSGHTTARHEERVTRALARMKAGLELGGPPYPSREELHDRAPR